MNESDDALVGLRFEVSGGLGRMAGRVLGKAGALYLVRKDGAAHLELLGIDDLRSAKFYADLPAAAVDETAGTDATSTEPATADPPRRRLADQIRKRLGGT